MRRIGRWLRNGLTGLSLVLCAATAALWVRSYFALDTVEFHSVLAPPPAATSAAAVGFANFPGICRKCEFVSTHGEAGMCLSAGPFWAPTPRWKWDSSVPEDLSLGRLRGPMGFYAKGWWPGPGAQYAWLWTMDKNGRALGMPEPAASDVIVDGRRRYLFVPHWFLTLLFAVLPLMGWRRRLVRLRREAVGRCRVCGYDLRASVGRCPECGTAMA